MSSGLQALLDRAAIQDLLLRYARDVDRRDLAAVATCFTTDCTYDGALGQGPIADVLVRLGAAMERYESTLHCLANQVIELDGDRARSETYAIAYHRRHDARLYVTAVRYCDDLVRAPEGWRIAMRIVRREWERTEPLEGSR